MKSVATQETRNTDARADGQFHGRFQMHRWLTFTAITLAIGLAAPGCSLLSKAAKGGSLSSADLVNEGESQNRDRERKAKEKKRAEERRLKDIASLEKGIEEDLSNIEEQRKNGRFSSSEYREKRLQKRLDELKEIDPQNQTLAAAPGRLEKIKTEWTEDVYNAKVLTAKCSQHTAKAKESRMEERWNYIDRNLGDYVKCRRKMVDVGIDKKVIKGYDKAAVTEYDAFIGHQLTQIEAYRKDSKFGYAQSMETGLETHFKYYKEIAPRSKKPKRYAKKMAKIQKKYRDPEEVKAERAQKDFEAWKTRVTESFTAEWEKTGSAEEAAKGAYDEGKAAAESGDTKTAVKKLLAARQQLYQTAYPSAVALDAAYGNGSLEKGLSYEISAALARIYFEQGNKAKLYPELSIIKNGRPWLSQDEELQVRMFDILADRKDKLSPKPTDTVRRYAGRYSKIGKEFKAVKEVAEARRGEAYGQLGVEVETISHRSAGSNAKDNVGKVVYVEEPVTKVDGKNLRFDFRKKYKVATKCWRTNKIAGYNVYTGRVYYTEKCKYKTVKDGYSLLVKKPKGVKVRKGDIVSFYAFVGKKKGKFDLKLVKPGYVRVAPNGQTKWFLGSKVKK